MLEVQKYLKIHTLDELETNFGIKYRLYDDRVVLNYNMIDSHSKYHPITLECRGLILSLPDYSILCRSFDRFFNLGEGDEKQNNFNWKKCGIFNKLDGTLINCYFDGKKWCVATRGTAFAEGKMPLGNSYFVLFNEAIGHDTTFFDTLNKENTYIFELTSPENRIVTKYFKTKITLLAIRNKTTGKYVDEVLSHVDSAESYSFNNPTDIKNFVESRDPMDEGCVCYDPSTDVRIKVKNSSYVAIHHLRGENGITKKSIVTLLLKNEIDEYLTHFVEDTKMVLPYVERYNQLKSDIIEKYELYKDIVNQKEFALKVKDFDFKPFLFSLRNGKELKDMFVVEKVKQLLKYFEGL